MSTIQEVFTPSPFKNHAFILDLTIFQHTVIIYESQTLPRSKYYPFYAANSECEGNDKIVHLKI